MILYFSGTGNSAYIAEQVSKVIQDDTCDLFQKIRNWDHSSIHSDTPWVIVTPTYAWRIPRIVHDWLAKTELKGNQDIYFVMTCAGSIGNAGAYAKKLCLSKRMNFCGCIPVIMPENYIALFQAPPLDTSLKIIDQAKEHVHRVSVLMKRGQKYSPYPVSFKDRINSGIVNILFYPLFVHSRKFYATKACISCGKCVKDCPLKNIRLENGKPVWEDRCTHCMACICGCPTSAIEYGKHSIGLERYTCPKTEE